MNLSEFYEKVLEEFDKINLLVVALRINENALIAAVLFFNQVFAELHQPVNIVFDSEHLIRKVYMLPLLPELLGVIFRVIS
jgi:hypothetical protein